MTSTLNKMTADAETKAAHVPHRWRNLSLLTGVFILIHGGSLLLDRTVPTSLSQLVVPFTSRYSPLTR